MHKRTYMRALTGLLVLALLSSCDSEDPPPLVQPHGTPPLLIGNDGLHGIEPFRLDPASGQIELLLDTHVGSSHGWPDRVLRVNGGTYFQANSSDGIPGSDVFITDGTPAGTHATALPASLTSGSGLTTTQGRYFVAQDGGVQELRLLAGGAVESTLLGSACRDDYAPDPALAFGNGVALAVVVACGELVLWQSDGTPNGTSSIVLGNVAEYVADTAPDYDLLVSRLHLHATPTRFYLGVCYLSSRCEVRATDGTLAGTALIGETPTTFNEAVVLGEALYFVGDGALRVATHTPAQTGTVATGLSAADFGVSSVTRLGNLLILNVHAGGSATVPGGRQIWRSDGTPAGTQLLVNVGARDIVDWAPAGNRIFFTTLLRNDPGVIPSTGELWSTDGTPAGTIELTNAVLTTGSVASFLECTDNIVINTLLADAFPKLYANDGEGWFLRQGPHSGINLWFSNGTVVGTRRMSELPDYNCAIVGLF